MGGKGRGRDGEERGGEVALPLSQIPGSAPEYIIHVGSHFSSGSTAQSKLFVIS